MAIKLALDSNRYTDLCRGEQTVIDLLQTAEKIYLPFIVIAELRAGFSIGTQSAENGLILRRFLNKPGVETLYASEATTHCYATLYRQLRQQGTPIPTNDIWIAALTIEHGLLLCTRDKHFANLPQITLC